MQVQTQCQCGAKFAFSEQQVGQAFRCSVCNQVFHVPPPGQKPIMAPSAAPPPQQKPIMAPQPPQHFSPQPMPQNISQKSSGSGAGCLAFALVMFVVLCIGGIGLVYLTASRTTSAISRSMSSIDGMVKMAENLEALANPEKIISDYTDKGYEQITTQVASEKGLIVNDRLYTCQVLDLQSDSSANLAILSQSAKLHGNIKGDVDFFGQVLRIEEGAVIQGDLNLGFAQMVDIKGTVVGKLTGGYQILQGEENVQGEIESKGALWDLIKKETMGARDQKDTKSALGSTSEGESKSGVETKVIEKKSSESNESTDKAVNAPNSN